MTAKRQFSALATSGWQGDGWTLLGFFDTRKAAEDACANTQTHDAKSTGYITAVAGDGRVCDDHGIGCFVIDTSRVNVREAHLRNRRCHVTERQDS